MSLHILSKIAAFCLLACSLVLGQTGQHRKIFASGGGNNLAFVQACNHNQTSSVTSVVLNIGASGTCSVPANPVAGHIVFMYEGNPNALSISCADTLSNSWTSVYDIATNQGYCWSILTTGGSADSITVTCGANCPGVFISFEFSGQNASPLDGTAQTNTIVSSTNWTLPNITTTNAHDVVIGCGTNNSTNHTFTASSGFTIPTDGSASGGGQSGACEYQIVNSATTYSQTIVVNTATTASGFAIAFKSS